MKGAAVFCRMVIRFLSQRGNSYAISAGADLKNSASLHRLLLRQNTDSLQILVVYLGTVPKEEKTLDTVPSL